MRDIKFRAWDGMMHEPESFERYQGISLNSYVRLEFSGRGVHAPDLILMQYTGFKDKNGAEIYEGDIVGLIHKKLGLSNSKVIVWDGASACFDWEDANGDSWPDGFTGFIDEYEVIGNLYENSELLK